MRNNLAPTSLALLLTQLKAGCKQAAPFDAYYDGKAAWDVLVSMSHVAASLPGEDTVHDAHFTKLIISPIQRTPRVKSTTPPPPPLPPAEP